MISSRIIKVIAVLCFALLAFILLVLRNNPATGFESSIYTGTPSIVWVVLVFSIVCGTVIILHQLYYRKETASNLWVIGLVLIVFSLAILFSAPALRAYTAYGRGDVISHLGRVRDLIFTGHTDGRNIYPVLHIYLAQLSSILDVSAMRLSGYLPAFFATILFMPFMYIFARFILPHKGQAILATIAGTAALSASGYGQVITAPNSSADMLLPLAFMLCAVRVFQVPKSRYSLLLIIMVLLLTPFHFVPMFALLLMMLFFWLPNRVLVMIPHNLYRIFGINKAAPPLNSNYQFLPITILLVSLLFAAAWFYPFYIWKSVVINIHTIIATGGPNQLDSLLGTIEFASGYGYSVIEQFFKRHGDLLIVGLLTMISFPILLKKVATNRELGKLFGLYGPLAALGITLIVLFFFNIQFGPARLLRYIEILGALFAGFILFEIINRVKNTGRTYLVPLSLALIALILLALQINGVFRAHYSRYTFTPSTHVTLADMKGFAWFVANKDTGIMTTNSSLAPWRFAHALLTLEERNVRPDTTTREYPTVPWHFGYDTNRYLGNAYNEDAYMVLDQNDRLTYVETYPEVAAFRFYTADFDRLEDDASLDRLYTNRGFEVWYIHPMAPFNPTPEMER
ncbi:MAG: hypothetical protein IIB13_04860 [Chloroflexi bacterium]|nr:hypothetical protein [Chloroflexota bacterium]